MSSLENEAMLEVKVPTLPQLFTRFFQIGAISFGGGIIAYERILLVDKTKWLDADDFMAFLAISQTMPGLNSVNLAVLAGDHLRGVSGAISAALGLVMPGSVFVLALGVLYTSNADHPFANLILMGIAAGACGLLTAITYKIGDEHWKKIKSLAIIISTFLLMSLVKLSLPIVLLVMAPIAIFLYRPSKAI
jgi:chromate transporter